MKPLVIYHDNCADGFGAAFAAWRKFGDEAEYLPMSYNTELAHSWQGRELYILDFSFPKAVMDDFFLNAKSVVWLDHHKTAFEMWCGDGNTTYYAEGELGGDEACIVLDNNKSGAMLAWEYFHPETEVPLMIELIDDRDRWQFKLTGTKEFAESLWSIRPWNFQQWQNILSWGQVEIERMCSEGAAILRAKDAAVIGMMKNAREVSLGEELGYLARFETEQWIDRLTGLACNSALHVSELGHALANKSGTFGLVWYMDKDNSINLSFRSNGDYDVSAIAKALGGGGHRNAAGAKVSIGSLMRWFEGEMK